MCIANKKNPHRRNIPATPLALFASGGGAPAMNACTRARRNQRRMRFDRHFRRVGHKPISSLVNTLPARFGNVTRGDFLLRDKIKLVLTKNREASQPCRDYRLSGLNGYMKTNDTGSILAGTMQMTGPSRPKNKT